MNEVSSRSHAVFTLALSLTRDNERQVKETKSSKFTFVDLAGSERTKKTGASGHRLKEANSINVTLSSLGTLISDLAKAQEQSAISKKKEHINYRNSKLTRLLEQSLGGNAKVSHCDLKMFTHLLLHTTHMMLIDCFRRHAVPCACISRGDYLYPRLRGTCQEGTQQC